MKVSVIITSYNKQHLLKRCIRGVLSQVTTFDFEIIIADDGSTDGTREYLSVLKEYWPENAKIKIKTVINDHVGMMLNFASALDLCKDSEYIAFCDNDDYWTDRYKLETQVGYMDSDRDCALCFTNVAIINDRGLPVETNIIPSRLDFNSLLKNNYVMVLTTMIRGSLYWKYANVYKFIKLKMNNYDYPIWLELSKRGSILYLDMKTAVYTVYTESYSHSRKRGNRLRIQAGVWWMKLYFMLKYGCRPETFFYFIYRTARDIYSIIFKRWYK